VARRFNRRLGDSFIARREMPHTNEEEENAEIYSRLSTSPSPDDSDLWETSPSQDSDLFPTDPGQIKSNHRWLMVIQSKIPPWW